MRVARLDLTRYGKFTGASLDLGEQRPGRPDLHVVYGPNEAGKSTAFSALLDLLFEIEPQSTYAFLHPYKTMKIGGLLEFRGAEPAVFGRVKLKQNSLLDGADQPVADGALLGRLGGLDRVAYRNMFSLDDESLEKGGQNIIASKGDLGQLLFSASAGLAELGQTLESLRLDADEFTRGRKSGLADLKRQLEGLKGEREALDTVLPVYKKLIEASETSRLAYERERAERNAVQARIAKLDRVLSALSPFARLGALRIRLEPLRDLPQPPQHWRDDLPTLQRGEIALATEIAGCAAEMARLTETREAIAVDDAVLQRADRIADLGETRDRFTGADKDLPERRRSLADHDAELAKLLRRIERDEDTDPDRLVLGASVLGALRTLTEQRSGTLAGLETAHRQNEQAQRMLAEAGAALAAAGGDGSSSGAGLGPLKSALAAVRANDPTLRRRQAQKARTALRDGLETKLAQLDPWTGTIEALGAARAPTRADLAAWGRSEADLARDLSRHAADVERLTAERNRLAAEQAAAAQHDGLVSEAGTTEIRALRDQAWANHRRDLRPETADLFETALRNDDRVIATRLTRSSELARLAEVARSLTLAGVDLADATRQRDGVVAAKAKLDATVEAAARGLGWPERVTISVSTLNDWLPKRAEALEQFETMRQADRGLAEIEADEGDARTRIAAALAAAGHPQADNAGFATLLAAADVLVDCEMVVVGLRAQHADRRRAADQQARDLATATEAEAAWQEAWRRTCAACWLGELGTPTVATVRVVLDALAELSRILEKRADLLSRIAKMEADQARYSMEVDSLADEVALSAPRGSVLDRASALAQRLAVAREDVRRRSDLVARLAELETERRRLGEANELQSKQAAAMSAFFGVETLSEVTARLEQVRERADLTGEAAALEGEIVAALAAPSLADAEGQLAAADRAAIETERGDLGPRLELLDQRTRDLWADYSRAQDAVAAVGGDDAVARLAEQRRTLLLSAEDQALRYLRRKIGVSAAEQALRVYRDKHRSSMMERASEAFRTISRGAYQGLAAQPGEKGEVLVALGAGSSKEATQLSKGTRFQLYLALRVAGYYEYCMAREPVPFVADDIMETFDDFRAEEAFRLFAGMAEVGQVIYLTHHRHLCDIARSICPDVRITELPMAA